MATIQRNAPSSPGGYRQSRRRDGAWVRLSVLLIAGAGSCFSQIGAPPVSGEPPWQAAERDSNTQDEDGPRACNAPGFTLDGSIANDNRRTTGLVLADGSYFPPVQQGLGQFGLENVLCEKAHLEVAVRYSLHDISRFEENRFHARGIYEGIPDVKLYGGFAYYDNPAGLYTSRSFYLMAGAEYPSFWGTTINADFLHDIHESGDWLTVMVSKRHHLHTTDHGAVFSYQHGLAATGTRSLPGDVDTPSMTGVPSVFYRGAIEVNDGPLVWYLAASPHVSLMSPETGVPKRHFLLTAGVRLVMP